MEGSFIVKKQINGRSFYVKVDLAVVETLEPGIEIDMAGFTTWKNAVTFAAEYFHRRYADTDKRGLKISMRYLHDMVPDTNNMIVFFAVVQALCDAFSIPCDLTIGASGKFVIPVGWAFS